MPELSLGQKFEIYEALLRRWQGAINLVSPATLDHARQRHFEDSLQLADLIAPGLGVFDLGSGAGFPGLVLAMARPDLNVTLIESDTKKCTFLSTVSRETMTPVTIVNQRIENVSRETIPAIITARALAPLDKLLDFAAPWAALAPALEMLLLKGAGAEAEIAAARTRYDFSADLRPSRTGDGFVVRLAGIKSRL